MRFPTLRAIFFSLVICLGYADCSAEPAAKVRIVLVGDSTVADQSGWGEAFGKLAGRDVECFNQARDGRSSKSFRDEGHWKEALALKPAWLLIQFGHNDQPAGGPARATDPHTTFPENLARYVDEARAAGAQPVLVTSMVRRNMYLGHVVPDLEPYVEATKRVAAEKHVPLVDLHARSRELVESLGPYGSAIMAPPGNAPGTTDSTHLNERGGKMIARLVVEELRKVAPELARFFPEKKKKKD
jgi:lysophospholipase L1-like esterase